MEKLIRDKIPVLAQLDANILKIRRPKSTAELLDFIKNKVNEETTELFDAIDQYNEDDLSTVNHAIEEFADVYTILYRLVTFFNIDVETISEAINSKIDLKGEFDLNIIAEFNK